MNDRNAHNDAQPLIDRQGAIMLALVIIIVFALSRFNASAGVRADLSTQSISTPALPTSAPAPIYYQPVPTMYPTIAPQVIDNRRIDDHRICILVVDCSQADQ